MLRLPPYHPDLNPIENVWGVLKRRIGSENVSQCPAAVEQLIDRHFKDSSKELWKNTCEKIRKTEQEYLRRDLHCVEVSESGIDDLSYETFEVESDNDCETEVVIDNHTEPETESTEDFISPSFHLEALTPCRSKQKLRTERNSEPSTVTDRAIRLHMPHDDGENHLVRDAEFESDSETQVISEDLSDSEANQALISIRETTSSVPAYHSYQKIQTDKNVSSTVSDLEINYLEIKYNNCPEPNEQFAQDLEAVSNDNLNIPPEINLHIPPDINLEAPPDINVVQLACAENISAADSNPYTGVCYETHERIDRENQLAREYVCEEGKRAQVSPKLTLFGAT